MKTIIPKDINHLTDKAIQDGLASALYALQRAEPDTPEYYSLRQQYRRWEALVYTCRTERYGFLTGSNDFIQEPLIPSGAACAAPKAPQPAWV